MNCFRGDLAHELWHVKTNSDLINKIGLEEFINLQLEMNKVSSLAFKTMAEHFSWKKAIEENENETVNITIGSQIHDYKIYFRNQKRLEILININKQLKETKELPEGAEGTAEEFIEQSENEINSLKREIQNGINEFNLCDTLVAHCARCIHDGESINKPYICDIENVGLR